MATFPAAHHVTALPYLDVQVIPGEQQAFGPETCFMSFISNTFLPQAPSQMQSTGCDDGQYSLHHPTLDLPKPDSLHSAASNFWSANCVAPMWPFPASPQTFGYYAQHEAGAGALQAYPRWASKFRKRHTPPLTDRCTPAPTPSISMSVRQHLGPVLLPPAHPTHNDCGEPTMKCSCQTSGLAGMPAQPTLCTRLLRGIDSME